MIKTCPLCGELFNQETRRMGVPYCEKHTFRDVGKHTFYPKEKGGKIKPYETKENLEQ